MGTRGGGAARGGRGVRCATWCPQTEQCLYLVTEAVTPLRCHLRDAGGALSEEEVAWGLQQLLVRGTGDGGGGGMDLGGPGGWGGLGWRWGCGFRSGSPHFGGPPRSWGGVQVLGSAHVLGAGSPCLGLTPHSAGGGGGGIAVFWALPTFRSGIPTFWGGVSMFWVLPMFWEWGGGGCPHFEVSLHFGLSFWRGSSGCRLILHPGGVLAPHPPPPVTPPIPPPDSAGLPVPLGSGARRRGAGRRLRGPGGGMEVGGPGAGGGWRAGARPPAPQ